MRISRIAVPALFGALLVALTLSARPPEPRTIQVTAKKYEFTPNRIELKVGEPVEITFSSEDAKHGFTCKDLNLEKVVFEKDKPVTVKFTPEKAGTFEFRCANFCGLGHSKMKGEFIVAPGAAENPRP